MQHYAVLRISDGTRSYPFLYDGQKLYCPDYNPEKFGAIPQYCFAAGTTNTQEGYAFEYKDFVAVAPFRHEGYNYQLGLDMKVSISEPITYISLTPWKDGTADPDYVCAQGAWFRDMKTLSTEVKLVDNQIHIVWDRGLGATKDQLIDSIKQYYNPRAEVRLAAEVVVMDENDIYWHSDKFQDNDYAFVFDLSGWPFHNNFQWKDDLRISSILHIELVMGEHVMHIDIRSNPFPLTQERFARLLQAASGGITKIKIKALEDMVISKPRIINKTIQKVVEMTSQTDSKANIIQPVFFRVRDVAGIIVHPEVTENICVNLDAYKSQVERFYIKIEGASFPEIGRTESGIIFKVRGNLLPGKLEAGTYYILNQDAELVTTGKYKYES